MASGNWTHIAIEMTAAADSNPRTPIARTAAMKDVQSISTFVSELSYSAADPKSHRRM